MIRTSHLLLRKSSYSALVYTLEICRQLYNAALEQRILAYRRQRVSLSFYDQCKDLTALRAADPEYRALSAVMTRLTVLHRLDRAMKAFFRRCKTGQKPGFPRFKGKGRFDTLVFGGQDWKIRGQKIHLHSIGTFRFTGSVRREGTLKGLRIKRVADRWEVQVLVDIGVAPAVRPAVDGVGIDVGIKTFATLSNGERVGHPRFLKKLLDELKTIQKCLSSKKRGSNRRQKAKTALQRLHRRIANRRRDFLHQTSRALVNQYDGFAVEALDIEQMMQQSPDDMSSRQARGLHRGIMDSAWSTFIFYLAYKAEEAGKPVVRVDPKGTSQRCSDCGTVVRKGLRVREHACPACGLVLDRDENAARNIYDLGWRSADNPGGCTTGHQDSCGGPR